MICPAASGCPAGSVKIAFPLLDEGWETGSRKVVEMIQRRTNFVGFVENDNEIKLAVQLPYHTIEHNAILANSIELEKFYRFCRLCFNCPAAHLVRL